MSALGCKSGLPCFAWMDLSLYTQPYTSTGNFVLLPLFTKEGDYIVHSNF